MGIVNPRRPGGGALAEYVCVPSASVAVLPKTVDLVEAATIPMNGLTAKMTLEALDLPPGAVLLVTGAAGAVGGYLIQLAKHAGLRVVADARDPDRELLLRLGVGEVVPRGKGMFPAVRARQLAQALRALPLPVVGRITEERLLLDLRCLEDARGFSTQLPLLEQALRA